MSRFAADITAPTADPQAAKPAAPKASAAGSAAADQPGSGPERYEAVGTGGPESADGQSLVVGSYMVIWLMVFGFMVVAWRRTIAMAEKVTTLERAIERARAQIVPQTKRSATELKAERAAEAAKSEG